GKKTHVSPSHRGCVPGRRAVSCDLTYSPLAYTRESHMPSLPTPANVPRTSTRTSTVASTVLANILASGALDEISNYPSEDGEESAIKRYLRGHSAGRAREGAECLSLCLEKRVLMTASTLLGSTRKWHCAPTCSGGRGIEEDEDAEAGCIGPQVVFVWVQSSEPVRDAEFNFFDLVRVGRETVTASKSVSRCDSTIQLGCLHIHKPEEEEEEVLGPGPKASAASSAGLRGSVRMQRAMTKMADPWKGLRK
ncbi:hypothetical protein B0H13DRAFT_2498332, partial [Mycena leptocephala]